MAAVARAPTKQRPGRRRLTVTVAVVAVGALLLGAGIVYLLRDAIAGAVARDLLAERGVTCTPLSLELAADLSRVVVAPTSCRVDGGRLESVGLPQGAELTLDGTRAESLVVPAIEIATADDGGGIDELAGGIVASDGEGPLPERLRRPIDALAALATEDLPRIAIGSVAVGRGDPTRIHLSDVGIDREPGGALTLSIARADPAGRRGGRVLVAAHVADIRGHATPSAVRIEGRLQITAGVGPLRVSRAVGFGLVGEGLDGSDARYRFSATLPDGIDRLRQAMGLLHERREDRQERREDRRGRRDEPRAPRDLRVRGAAR